VPRLKILFAVSECVPLIKTGGLGDVAGALPIELRRRGHDVRVLMPRYRSTTSYPAVRHSGALAVPSADGERWCAVWEARLPGDVPAYLLEHDVLYDRDGVYGDSRGEFGDNVERFALLSRAVLPVTRYLDFVPDLVHVHDWPTALVPVYLRAQGVPIATVLSIHNLGYQGRYGMGRAAAAGLSADEARWLGLEHQGDLNLLKGGLMHATWLSTVSPRYAAEIQTPLGGAGLDDLMRARSGELVGILNGIDDVRWDPQTDRHLPAHYGPDDLSGKAECKRALQRELELMQRADVPLVALISRLATQKGIDVLAAALEPLLSMDLQLVLLGSGEAWAERLFTRLSVTAPHLRARIGLDEGLAHRIEAAADLFLMPSRYEPCGLNQLYSQRYGTLPIVRAVGGLRDTVEHEVTGFVFEELSPAALCRAVGHAIDVYRKRPDHFRYMQGVAMRKRMGWDRAAAQYEALYRLAIARNAGRS
jgi:starch synthase